MSSWVGWAVLLGRIYCFVRAVERELVSFLLVLQEARCGRFALKLVTHNYGDSGRCSRQARFLAHERTP